MEVSLKPSVTVSSLIRPAQYTHPHTWCNTHAHKCPRIGKGILRVFFELMPLIICHEVMTNIQHRE